MFYYFLSMLWSFNAVLLFLTLFSSISLLFLTFFGEFDDYKKPLKFLLISITALLLTPDYHIILANHIQNNIKNGQLLEYVPPTWKQEVNDIMLDINKQKQQNKEETNE